MKLKIAQLGQPVLRKPAVEVSAAEIASDAFQQFLRDMTDTVTAEQGAGLAAPQVFASKRVFLALLDIPEDDDAPRQYTALINPRIVGVSQETQQAWEGCLSFPELVVLVSRHKAVRVEYLDSSGQPQTIEVAGFPARVVQHEFDHLNGILTIDRAASTRDIIKASELDTVLSENDEAESYGDEG
jgi:peptide deformylase